MPRQRDGPEGVNRLDSVGAGAPSATAGATASASCCDAGVAASAALTDVRWALHIGRACWAFRREGHGAAAGRARQSLCTVHLPHQLFVIVHVGVPCHRAPQAPGCSPADMGTQCECVVNGQRQDLANSVCRLRWCMVAHVAYAMCSRLQVMKRCTCEASLPGR